MGRGSGSYRSAMFGVTDNGLGMGVAILERELSEMTMTGGREGGTESRRNQTRSLLNLQISEKNIMLP